MKIIQPIVRIILISSLFVCIGAGKRPSHPTTQNTPETASVYNEKTEDFNPEELTKVYSGAEEGAGTVSPGTAEDETYEYEVQYVEVDEEGNEYPVEGNEEINELPGVPSQEPEAVSEKQAIHRVWIWQETGDCLWNLARKYYGDPWKWKLIYLANKDVITDPSKIFPKQELIIPKDE